MHSYIFSHVLVWSGLGAGFGYTYKLVRRPRGYTYIGLIPRREQSRQALGLCTAELCLEMATLETNTQTVALTNTTTTSTSTTSTVSSLHRQPPATNDTVAGLRKHGKRVLPEWMLVAHEWKPDRSVDSETDSATEVQRITTAKIITRTRIITFTILVLIRGILTNV